jgi:hypothetical protein
MGADLSDDYYREMFRLRGLSYPEATVQRPQYFGKLTNDIVCKRIAPGVLDELKRVQRKGSTGNRKTVSFNDLPQMPGIRSCANTLAPLSP